MGSLLSLGLTSRPPTETQGPSAAFGFASLARDDRGENPTGVVRICTLVMRRLKVATGEASGYKSESKK
jgi:hypothetical protein